MAARWDSREPYPLVVSWLASSPRDGKGKEAVESLPLLRLDRSPAEACPDIRMRFRRSPPMTVTRISSVIIPVSSPDCSHPRLTVSF